MIIEEDKEENFEIIVMHDPGESNSTFGAGIKLMIPEGKGSYIWRYIGA
jgi:hypothetical protein